MERSEPGEPGYELVMPFVCVTSKGGPYDDESFTAGWQMGALYCLLDRVSPPVHEDTIRTNCCEQADLIAMRYGYTATFEQSEIDEWTFMTLTKDVGES